jgi:hypothetical protein
MFHNSTPFMVNDHLMPVGLDHPSPTFPDLPWISRAGNEIDVTDSTIMSAQGMMDHACRQKHQDLFLTGRTRDGTLICLDLEKDAVQPDKVIHSYDFDSLIWTTKWPRFRNAISVYTTPVIRRRAPIWKNNHVYLQVLLPPSEEDHDSPGPRAEFWSKRFGLSKLPHIPFGKLGDGAGAANIYLFFPRMAHQDHYTRRWMANVPSDIQNLFFDHVLTPAMKTTSSQLDHPYVGLTRENLQFKGAGGRHQKGETSKSPTFPFRKRHFEALVEKIREMACSLLCSPVKIISDAPIIHHTGRWS